MTQRLYRSRTDRMVAGVCGGLGEYLKLDATLIRIAFVLLSGNIGWPIYFILWLVVPVPPVEGEAEGQIFREPGAEPAGAQEWSERVRSLGDEARQVLYQADPKTLIVLGGLLILMGVVSMLDRLDLSWLHGFDFDQLWPVLLIIAGVAMIWRRAHDR